MSPRARKKIQRGSRRSAAPNSDEKSLRAKSTGEGAVAVRSRAVPGKPSGGLLGRTDSASVAMTGGHYTGNPGGPDLRNSGGLSLQHLQPGRTWWKSRGRDVSFRHIGAAGLLGKGISRDCEGPGARASADLLVLAGAAFAFEHCSVAQVAEDRRVSIDRRQIIVADASAGERQEAAGKDLAGVRDEDETFSVIQPARRASDRVGNLLRGGASIPCLALGDGLLQHVTPIVLRLGGLDVEARGLRKTIEPGKDLFELLRVQQLVQLSAAGRHQEKDAPQRDLETFHQRNDLVDLANVSAAEGGVDLHRQPDLACPANRIHRALV